MSLRWRLVLAFVVLAGAAVAVAATVAYEATANRLYSQVDRSLTAAAVGLRAAPPPGAAQGPLARPPAGTAPVSGGVAGGGSGESLASGGGSGGHALLVPGGPRGPAALLDLVAIQRISPTGAVTSRGSLTLPVTARDRQIAADGGQPWLRTVDVQGAPYRIVTVATAGGALEVAQGLGQITGALGELQWWFALLAVLVALLAAAAGWLVARRVVAPLAALTDAAEEIAQTGSFEGPHDGVLPGAVDAARRDEVGRLARTFTAMVAALRRGRDQQRQLVRDAGHELRTPLTSLRANIDVLRRHGSSLDPGAMSSLLGDLDTELRELSHLVDEVVELATDSRMAEPVGPVDMADLVGRVAERSGARWSRVVAVDAAPWTVTGAPRALERAVANLVENACKFSPAGTSVEVVTRPGVVVVRDHGPGIAPGDLERIFDRFYRSDSARSLPGSGLGLAIVRQIAESHRGSVVAAGAPGGGALVTLRLPNGRAAGWA